VTAFAVLALAAPAAGQAGADVGGGAVYVAMPEVVKVTCMRRCASRQRAQGASTVRIAGSALAATTAVTFHGSYGSGDDAVVEARSDSDSALNVRVPIGAVTGPVSVTTREKVSSAPTKPVAILPPPPPAPNAELTPVPGPQAAAGLRLETGTSRTKAFVGARRAVTFSFRLSGPAPASLMVELVSTADGAVLRSWAPSPAAPGDVQSVSWDGRIGSVAATPGRYSFRLTAAGADGSSARSAQVGVPERDAFDLYDHVFPVRGAHDFGGPGAGFGSGRTGHSHQGHDVFAACGTPMVAARGGRVKFKQYHAAAGNYLVIDADGTDVDYAYMHLAEPTPFAPGDRVYTGQRIGSVGESGNARGCHLHFELWSEPGWYDGGRPFDPLPSLEAWDGWS
jgi:murein DD-endopeptidase MepM/ murein hydrolase activator NlpD